MRSAYSRTASRWPISWLGAMLLYAAHGEDRVLAHARTGRSSNSAGPARRQRTQQRALSSQALGQALVEPLHDGVDEGLVGAAPSVNAREPRSRSARSSAVFSESWRASIAAFSCEQPGLIRLARMAS